MFPLFFSMAALAQAPLPSDPPPEVAQEEAESREPIVIETISVTGRVPKPEIQVVISRPRIPILTTTELLESIDARLAEAHEEEKR